MFKLIVLGIIQGIFEWLPVSSEGIVALLSKYLVSDFNPIEIALFLHLGTVLAVLIYFRKEWRKVIELKDNKLLRFLIISTAISFLIGYPLYNTITDFVIGSNLLILVGFGLLITAFFHKKKISLNMSEDKTALLTGFLQGLSVIPGLSRSGSTIFGLSLGSHDTEKILTTSYMMSLPVILGSTIYLFLNNPVFIIETWPALLSSFLVGLVSLDFLIKKSKEIDFFKFVLTFSVLCFLGALLK
ncbi:MAG: undecaprenyl-diphosphate phosphatase [Patescibacteria group bacterium]